MYNLLHFAMAVLGSGIMIMNIPVAKRLYSKEFFEAWPFATLYSSTIGEHTVPHSRRCADA